MIGQSLLNPIKKQKTERHNLKSTSGYVSFDVRDMFAWASGCVRLNPIKS